MRDQLIAHIRTQRNELTQAFNPYSLQKILDETLKILEYMLTGGQVVAAHPNQVPGLPVNPLDTGKAKVELFGGPESAFGRPQPPTAPSPPVINGDVQFTRIAGGAIGGQAVEFYAGPPGSEHARPNPEQTGGQRVEMFGGPPLAQAPAPTAPPTVYNPVNTVNNPPQASYVPGRPPMTVEAGEKFPTPISEGPSQGLPMATPFAHVMPTRARPAPPPPIEPQNRDEMLNMLPIPLIDNP
jgi:hypothetical protein